jgi:hypothetical protein
MAIGNCLDLSKIGVSNCQGSLYHGSGGGMLSDRRLMAAMGQTLPFNYFTSSAHDHRRNIAAIHVGY